MPFKRKTQARGNNDNGKVNYATSNRPIFKNGNKQRAKYYYPPRFQYYQPPFGFQTPWNFFRWKRPPFRMRPNVPPGEPSRPPSPFSGTEEYTLKKIQETSDMIKKQLMMSPEENIKTPSPPPPPPIDKNNENKKNDKCDNEKSVIKNKKPIHYNVEEIHNKIITHITNLNHGKKMNLICSTSSGYDAAIQQIQKQKRLELSKVLRDMCSNQTVENSDVINSIIPDIGIKLEDLPLEVIQKLSSTLDMNFDDGLLHKNDDEIVKIKTETEEIEENDGFMSNDPILMNIKVENNTDDMINDCIMSSIEITNYPQENIPPDVSTTVMKLKEFNSECTQTNSVCLNTNSTQTELDMSTQLQIKNKIENLDDAIKTMMEIDKEIARLTKLRQSIFLKLQTKNKNSIKKNKTKNESAPVETQKNNASKIPNPETNKHDTLYEKELDFGNITEKILVITVVKDVVLAGSESGRVLYFNLKDGSTVDVINVVEFPITSFCLRTMKKKNIHFFVSSFDTNIREYNFDNRNCVRLTHVGESVQCMELSWDFIFIGTVNGSLMRYSLVRNKIEFEDKISKDRILVLKATQEGARRILLVGTKNLPVCIRDAMSGLHMRTMNEIVAPTVYSLLLEKSLVYCGTTFHDILVFSFHDGNLIRKYQASNSKGIGCMKIVENLLYASCHNGNIYVYNIKTRQYMGQIEGPGGVILSMEIFKNLIIVGTMSFKFKSLLIPEYILESNRSAFD